jgi:hypothetical protein
MSDTIDDFKAMKKLKKELNRSNKVENIKQIVASGIPFAEANEGECLLFRKKEKPKVDFFPSTGRWRHNGRNYSGGAAAFLKWYKEQ